MDPGVLGPHWRDAVAVGSNAHLLEYREDHDKTRGGDTSACPSLRAG